LLAAQLDGKRLVDGLRLRKEAGNPFTLIARVQNASKAYDVFTDRVKPCALEVAFIINAQGRWSTDGIALRANEKRTIRITGTALPGQSALRLTANAIGGELASWYWRDVFEVAAGESTGERERRHGIIA